MTDEEIERALKLCSNGIPSCEGCPFQDYEGCISDVKDYINRLKANIESVVQSFIRLETLYTIKCDELEIAEAKIQSNLEKAYEHNTEECKRCMSKIEIKQQCAEDDLKEQIRKETAKEILQPLYEKADISTHDENNDFAYVCFQFRSRILAKAKKYGVEIEK